MLARSPPPPLPAPRGPLTSWLVQILEGSDPGAPLPEPPPDPSDDPVRGEDAPLALYLCYELHYRGLDGVDERWEWAPDLLRLRQDLEARLEARLKEFVGTTPAYQLKEADPHSWMIPRLWGRPKAALVEIQPRSTATASRRTCTRTSSASP